MRRFLKRLDALQLGDPERAWELRQRERVARRGGVQAVGDASRDRHRRTGREQRRGIRAVETAEEELVEREVADVPAFGTPNGGNHRDTIRVETTRREKERLSGRLVEPLH